MRHTFPVLTALGFAATLALTPAAGRADEAPASSVLDFANAMEASAARIDAEIADRQRAGDMAAAQRLVLAAGMVRRAAEEFRGAEQAALNDPISSLPAPIPERVDAALAKAAEAEKRAGDTASFADRAQATFNALLSTLPQPLPHPVLYGMLSGDLADASAPLGRDVVFYGHRLIDPRLKLAPVVLYGKTEIDPSNVVVKDDRIDVTLPAQVKQAIDFAPSPCQTRPSFGLRVRSYYAEQRGFWPILWYGQGASNADFYALSTPLIYAAKMVVTAETTTAKTRTVSFSQRSNLTIADCEQTSSAEVRLPLPESARNASCAAAWINTSGATKATSRCSVEGRNVHAYGEISGGVKICSPEKLCTCSAQAQGWLEATGAYDIVETATAVDVAADWPQLTFPAGGVAHGRIGLGDREKLRHVTLNLTRRACPTQIDTIDLTVGEDPNATVTGVSKTGVFRASLQGGALTVGAADALAASDQKTP